jgi:hypothetical protein
LSPSPAYQVVPGGRVSELTPPASICPYADEVIVIPKNNTRIIGMDKIVFKSKKKLAKAIVKRYSNNQKMPKIAIKIQFK